MIYVRNRDSPTVRNRDIRLHDLCLKSGQPNCPKSGQTKLGRCGNLGSYLFNIKQPGLVSQDFCPDFRQKKVSKIGTKVPRFQTVSEIETVWEWDTTELSEIQTSSHFRHSL